MTMTVAIDLAKTDCGARASRLVCNGPHLGRAGIARIRFGGWAISA